MELWYRELAGVLSTGAGHEFKEDDRQTSIRNRIRSITEYVLARQVTLSSGRIGAPCGSTMSRAQSFQGKNKYEDICETYSERSVSRSERLCVHKWAESPIGMGNLLIALGRSWQLPSLRVYSTRDARYDAVEATQRDCFKEAVD